KAYSNKNTVSGLYKSDTVFFKIIFLLIVFFYELQAVQIFLIASKMFQDYRHIRVHAIDQFFILFQIDPAFSTGSFLKLQGKLLTQQYIFQMAALDIFSQLFKAFFHKFFMIEIPFRGNNPVKHILMYCKMFSVYILYKLYIFIWAHRIHPGHWFYSIKSILRICFIYDVLDTLYHILPGFFSQIFFVWSIPSSTF